MARVEKKTKYGAVLYENVAYFYLFIIPVFLFVITITRKILKNYNNPFNPRILYFALAAFIALIVNISIGPGEKFYATLQRLPVNIAYAILFPPYIMHTILNTDYFIFCKYWICSVIISTVGVIFQACMFNFIYKGLYRVDWTETQGILYSFIVCLNQPQFTISVFKSLSRYKFLGFLLEIECILSMVTIELCSYMCILLLSNEAISVTSAMFFLIKDSVLATIYGILIAKIYGVCLNWFHDDFVGAIISSFSVVYISFIICSDGILSRYMGSYVTLIIALNIAANRHKLPIEVESNLCDFWSIYHHILDIIAFMIYVIQFIIYLNISFDMEDLTGIIITYYVALLSRFTAFFLLSPILRKMGSKLDLKCFIALGWSGIKGTSTLAYLQELYSMRYTNILAQEVLVELTLNVFLTALINSSAIKILLKILGLSSISIVKKTNMDNCMRFIMERRDKAFFLLKLNRYLTAVNWDFARKASNIRYPYHLDVKDKEHDAQKGMFKTSDNLICPDCLKEIYLDISKTEREEVIKQARGSIVKAKRVSIIRQYECGLIDHETLQYLLQIFEMQSESDEKNDMFSLNLMQTKTLHILQKLFSLQTDRSMLIPKEYCGRLCYYIVMHKCYELVISGFILIRFSWFIYELFALIDNKLHIIFDLLTILPFIVEIFVKVIAFSAISISNAIRIYFHYFWNIFDSIVLIFDMAHAIHIIVGNSIIVSNVYSEEDPLLKLFYVVCRLIILARILHMLKLLTLGWFLNNLQRVMDNTINSRIVARYELAEALMTAYEEILYTLVFLIEYREVRNVFRLKLETEKTQIMKSMESVQRTKPFIPITVKTKQAIRALLVAMRDCLEELRASGFVDIVEYQTLHTDIDAKKIYWKRLKFVHPNSPLIIFKEVSWMSEDDKIVNFLYENTLVVYLDVTEGTTFIRPGKPVQGIYIIVSGVFRLKYEPKKELLDVLSNHQILPIIDYLSTTNFLDPFEDVITAGCSFGELAILTHRPSDCTIYPETNAHLFFIPSDVIRKAIQMSSYGYTGLEAKLWKHSTINLVVAILAEQPMYAMFRTEQLKVIAENGFVPNLKMYKVFGVTEMMEHIILLTGKVINEETMEEYYGPCYLPKNVNRILFTKENSHSTAKRPDSINQWANLADEFHTVKLYIVAVYDSDIVDIMAEEELIAEMQSAMSTGKQYEHQPDLNGNEHKHRTTQNRSISVRNDKVSFYLNQTEQLL